MLTQRSISDRICTGLLHAVSVATADSDIDTHEPDSGVAMLFEGSLGEGPNEGLAPGLQTRPINMAPSTLG